MSEKKAQGTLGDPGDQRLEALMGSFVERYRRGENPQVTEYAAKHPELGEKIKELFPALLFLEKLETDRTSRADATTPSGAPAAAGGKEIHRLGEYRILREIGRGGMGVVYEAEQESLGRHVALKVLPFHHLLDARHLERFRREARAAAMLQHPNIVPVYGVGEEEGIHYYAMQFIPGQGLDEVLVELKRLRSSEGSSGNGGNVPASSDESSTARLLLGSTAQAPSAKDSRYFQNVAELGARVAQALAYAHAQGILHRDIKPSNLLLDSKGTVWVTDFGLAKAEGSEDVTQSGEIVGTLRYMAPERFRGWSDPRSDVYSLGLTLYEIMTFQPAFDDTDRARLLKKVTEEEPTRPRKLDPRVPRDLETVVMTAMAREPGQRYQSAADLAEDLKRYLAHEPIRARQRSVWEQGVKWVRRRPAVAALAACLVLVLFAGSLWHSARLEIEARKTRETFDKAREPVAELLTSMEKNQLTQPSTQVELLESVLRFFELRPYEGLHGERAADPALLLATEQAYHLLGDSHKKSREYARAEGSYQRALEILEGLPPANQTTADRRHEAFVLQSKLSLVLAAADQPEKSLQAFLAANALLESPATFRFELAGKFTVGKDPFSIIAGDLDGDNDLDLATVNVDSDNVTVLINKGDGSFEDLRALPVEDAPNDLTAADLDGDKDLDLAVANHNSGSLSIFLNQGAASFAPGVRHPIGNRSFLVEAADLDRDGDIDLIASGGEDKLSLLLNQGAGTFSTAAPLTVDMLPNAVAIADLDRDGDLDVAAACSGYQSPGSISLLLNDGEGNYSAGARLPAGQQPMSVLCADLDQDGAEDIVAANIAFHHISVLRNTGDGSFGEAVRYDAGNRPYALQAEDFDGDGDRDLVVANTDSDEVMVFLNDGQANFAWPLRFGLLSAPFAMVAGDLDGDGRPDLAVANSRTNEVWFLRNQPLGAK